MTHEILLIDQVAARLGTSVATVNRYLALRRKGQGSFPLPISPFKGKGRWLASDVDGYIESLSNANVAPPVKSEKQKAKEFIERQESAKATLRKHGIER